MFVEMFVEMFAEMFDVIISFWLVISSEIGIAIRIMYFIDVF